MDNSAQSVSISRWMPAMTKAAWLVLAATFMASGILKGIAVRGFALTIGQFLDLLGLGGLHPYALPVAIAICIGEIALGFAALFRKLRPFLCVVFLAVLIFFTIITYVNLTDMYGGIESCGCFGEIIHLNPLETFLKNILLLTLTVTLTINTYLTNSTFSSTEKSHAERQRAR